jgi:hypothetical protein
MQLYTNDYARKTWLKDASGVNQTYYIEITHLRGCT